MSKTKNIVTLKLTAAQFSELMRLFDWRFQFVNVDHNNAKVLWATVIRQAGGIPKPAYDLGETDPPKMPENRVIREDQAVPNEKHWWTKLREHWAR